jgi:uncharacterized membrane protein YdjX (TVP38/TMEM64 family)
MIRKRYLFALFFLILAIPVVAHLLITKTNIITILKSQRNAILCYVCSHYKTSVLLFMGTYILVTALCIPEAALLTTAGGFLFGTTMSTIYVTVAGTVGALVAFLIIRFFLGSKIQEHYKLQLEPFNKAFEHRGRWYMLLVHLIPGIPFVLINILAAMTNVAVWTFAWTTLVGIIPGTLMYSFVGEQLRKVHMSSFSQQTYIFAVIGFFAFTFMIRLVIIKIARMYKLHH